MPIMKNSVTTRFCLIRHGETDWNSQKRVQGQIDIDLNATGEAQARAVRAGLAEYSFIAAYSSDLLRASRTAQIATAGFGFVVSLAPALRERHYGQLQGLTPHEASTQLPDAHRHRLARTPGYDYESGESLIAFAARVMAGLELLAARHAGGNVLAFTHGGVLDIAYRAATGRGLEEPRDFPLQNAAVNWLEFCGGNWRLVSWADSSHFQQGLDEVLA
jgi:probable phosphoglycerate mutase